MPIGLAIGLGRFRGRQVLRVLANASLALPPVLVGAFLFVLFLPQAPLGSLQLIWTKRVVFVGQTILALPFIVALTAAAVQGLPPGLLAQARLLGAGRIQVSTLALREARIGVMAAVIAALGTALSEVAAVAILGGNIYGYNQTLASATLYEANGGYYADALAIAIVLTGLILILMCGLAVLQHQGNGIRLRLPVSDMSAADPPESGPVLLRCEHLTVRRGKRDVVSDVSAELRAGEIVALLGPNGAGKSTLLDALAGALPASAGRVERHGRVGVALQSPDLARRTVLANVTLALAWWGVPRPERAERAREALRAIGAEHLARRRAATLSGGERRRVHLARAIAVQPDVLLLDEPFAGLDAEVRANLLEDALSALRSSDRATLVVVHDRAEAWALADRLLILIDGRLVGGRSAPRAARAAAEHRGGALPGLRRQPRGRSRALLTRPAHVALDPAGPLEARVTRAVALEDGVRLELELEHGRLYAVSPLPAPRPGDSVRVRIDGGARFPLPTARARSTRGSGAGHSSRSMTAVIARTTSTTAVSIARAAASACIRGREDRA